MKINVKGPIISNDEQWIYDYFEVEATSPKKVSDAIENAKGGELEVDINSGGGSVFAGSEIYTALKSYAGKVTIRIVGIAASAASVIAMAGQTVLMSPTAQMMIHNVSTRAEGDHRDMAHQAEVLKNANETVANAYRIKSGMEQKDLLAMMNKETWLTAQQALEHNLIDEVMFEPVDLVASYNNMLPTEVINKMITHKKAVDNDTLFLIQQSKLKLLKMKGNQNE